MNPKLILASGSPRRQSLLAESGFEFEVIPSPAEEVHCDQIPLVELCEMNAKAKAQCVAAQHPDAVVLGADTLVYIDESPLGKPEDLQQAAQMLEKLSGRSHQVCTGLCLVQGERVVTFHEVTKVTFKEFTAEVIEEYLQRVDVLDKAGSYAIQEFGELIVDKIVGGYSNVVGLPQELVAQKLREFAIEPITVAEKIPDGHRYPLLFNPNARSKRGRRALRFLMSHATEFVLYATRSADDARELAAKFAKDGEPVVLAAGGDGTLNAVVQGLLGTETALGVLPAGTMNVFAREMGIPIPTMQHSNLPKALEVIKEGHLTHVDLFTANGQPFVQMAGVGFDAHVIEQTTVESKKMLGPLAYLVSAVKLLGDNPPRMKVICSDGKEIEGVAVLAGNGELYGGQVRLFPSADNTDGLLDILVFKESGYRFVVDMLKGMAGVLDLVKSSVEYHQAASFRVVSDRPVPLEVDGELIGRSEEIIFKPTGSKLKVLSPKAPAGGFVKVWKEWVQNLPRKIVGE